MSAGKILVVDDDAMLASALKGFLTREKYSVEVARSAALTRWMHSTSTLRMDAPLKPTRDASLPRIRPPRLGVIDLDHGPGDSGWANQAGRS